LSLAPTRRAQPPWSILEQWVLNHRVSSLFICLQSFNQLFLLPLGFFLSSLPAWSSKKNTLEPMRNPGCSESNLWERAPARDITKESQPEVVSYK
jgi:hypothetical protein